LSVKGLPRGLSIVKTGLFMIANAMIVHEALVASGALQNVQPLANIDRGDPQGWLINEWSKILNTNYRSVFDPAIKLLKSMPSHPVLKNLLLNLANVARKAVSSRAALRHDLAGRLYHTLLLRDIAKGLATYYTSLPAATTLASLALDWLSVNGKPVDWGNIDEIAKLRIADFACGSGTLLSAVYSEIMDRHIMNSKGKPNLSGLHKVLLENVLYGFDVLEYAVHLTATSLVLRDPRQTITNTNTYVVPLGVHNSTVYLGSLDMESRISMVVFPRLRTLLGGFVTSIERKGVDIGEESGFRMEKPDLVIMNPPFARTGNVGKSSLFGHLPRADRKEVLDKLKALGKKTMAQFSMKEGFGRAGLAAYFLLKAFEVSKPNAVLAFVLPRVFLGGSDWRSVRGFLAERGVFRYIIVSDDPNVLWAWSENTNLSEILVVYQKGVIRENEDATVVYVRRRPSSALEARIYASLIKSASRQLEISRDSALSSTEVITMNGDAVMYIYKVRGSAVRRVADVNMNIVMGFHSPFLSEIAYKLYVDKEFAGLRLPLIPLSKYVEERLAKRGMCKPSGKRRKVQWDDCVGYDVAQVRRKCVGKGNIPVKFLAELNMNTFSSLKLPPSAVKTIYVPSECLEKSGRLLIAGVARLWLPTIGVVATYSYDPVLSQVAWTIPLDSDEAKIQALWLNTTLGLIHFLSMRQDSKGGFVQLKKKTLGELLIVDTTQLDENTKTRLLEPFDKYAGASMGDFLTQLQQASARQGSRYDFDVEFLRALGASNKQIDLLTRIYDELKDETLFRRRRN